MASTQIPLELITCQAEQSQWQHYCWPGETAMTGGASGARHAQILADECNLRSNKLTLNFTNMAYRVPTRHCGVKTVSSWGLSPVMTLVSQHQLYDVTRRGHAQGPRKPRQTPRVRLAIGIGELEAGTMSCLKGWAGWRQLKYCTRSDSEGWSAAETPDNL